MKHVCVVHGISKVTKDPQMGVARVNYAFIHFGSLPISGTDKARHFKSAVHINRSRYQAKAVVPC